MYFRFQVLLSSPHLGSLRGRVEGLLATVRQLLELVSLLVECQDKVGGAGLQLMHIL